MTDTEILSYLQICLDRASNSFHHDIVLGTVYLTLGRGDDIRNKLNAAIVRDEPHRIKRVEAALLKS